MHFSPTSKLGYLSFKLLKILCVVYIIFIQNRVFCIIKWPRCALTRVGAEEPFIRSPLTDLYVLVHLDRTRYEQLSVT